VRVVRACLPSKSLVKCGRNEVSGPVWMPRVSVAHHERFVFYILFYYSSSILLFISHLASRSTPTKTKKAGVSESLTPPPRPMVEHIIRMSAFSAKPENETARCRSVQFFHQPAGRYRHCEPSWSAIKASCIYTTAPHPSSRYPIFPSNSSYDGNVFRCKRDPLLDFQGPPPEPTV